MPENDRRKNNTVIAGLDPAIHKHKALAHDMHIESNAFQQMFAPLPMLRSSWPQLVMFGLCFSLQSYSGLSRTSKHRRHAERVFRGSKDTRQGLTICTQKATRFNKGSCRSRCCGQAGYSLRASAPSPVRIPVFITNKKPLRRVVFYW